MVNQEMKELYEANPSDWVVYYTRENMDRWGKLPFSNPEWQRFNTYKLIAKKDEHIADSIIANPDVEIEWTNTVWDEKCWTEEDNFFGNYETHLDYRLKENKPD